MSCVCVSEYSEKKLGKDEVFLCDAMDFVATKLRKQLRSLGMADFWRIEISKDISVSDITKYINYRNKVLTAQGFVTPTAYKESVYSENKMRPDGGCLWLCHKITSERYPILISEMKYQGTNIGRLAAGKKKQACGNAIERLGRYVDAFRPLYRQEKFFPFVTFVFGCDFKFDENGNPLDSASQTQGCKLSSFVEHRPFNRVYTRKLVSEMGIDKEPTIMAREDIWTIPEMSKILLEVGMDSLNYFVDFIKVTSGVQSNENRLGKVNSKDIKRKDRK